MLAELYATGATREQMSEVMGVHKDTISSWCQRPDIQTLVTEISQQRANKIVRKIDSTIEGRLQNAEKLDTKELLDIRKELAPNRVEVDWNVKSKDAVEEVLAEFFGQMDQATSQAAAEDADPNIDSEESDPHDVLMEECHSCEGTGRHGKRDCAVCDGEGVYPHDCTAAQLAEGETTGP